MKKAIAIILAVVMIFGLAACGGGSKKSGSDSDVKYKIALSNSFLENGWRQEMVAVAELIVKTDPAYEGIQLDVYNTENTTEAQSASLESLIEMGYDAFLIDCASDTGLNNVIDKATEKGIVCVTFDSCATTDSSWNINLDYNKAFALVGALICEAIGGKGEIAMDWGNKSTTNGQGMHNGALLGVQEFPDVKVVAEYEGQWSDGLNQDAVSTILATQNLDAVISESHGFSVLNAFHTAGVDPVPTTGDVYNCSMVGCYNDGVFGGFVATYTGMSIFALDYAIDILNGKEYDKDILIAPDALLVNIDKCGGQEVVDKWADYFDANYVVAEYGKDFSADWPDQFMWPTLPSFWPHQLKADDVIAYLGDRF